MAKVEIVQRSKNKCTTNLRKWNPGPLLLILGPSDDDIQKASNYNHLIYGQYNKDSIWTPSTQLVAGMLMVILQKLTTINSQIFKNLT